MRRWVPYPFVRFTIYFIAGILTSLYLEGWIQAIAVLGLLAMAIYVVLQILSSRGVHQYFVLPIGVCGFFALFCLGYINVFLSDDTNAPAHLIHKPTDIYQNAHAYQAKVVEPLKEKEKTFSTLVELEAIRRDSIWEKAVGKVLVYIKKDSLSSEALKYGDRIVVNMRIQAVSGPKNPNAFDYRKYLAYQNVHFTAFTTLADVWVLQNKGNDVFGFAFRAQQACAEIIRKNIRDREAAGIVLSLVLGLKDDLEQPLKTAYASAGVMHILAVSGLHVGIFYAILLFLLGWMNHGKYKWLFALVCLLVLWTYAFITGLSPSVLRAVTMFSSIIIAKAFARQYNVYNAIAASAFFLLCYNPFLIMSVGFQLSYTAVLGIVFLFQKFYQIFSIENRFLDAVWKMTSVSLAAQVAVFPLSVYYFHQFPVYFLLANLFVIPAAFAILVLGIGLLVLHFLPGADWLIGIVLEFFVLWVNKFVYFVNTLPQSNLSNLYISGWQVVFLTGMIIGLLIFSSVRKFGVLVGVVFLFCCFQVADILHQLENQNKSMTYYSSKTAGIVGLSEGDYSKLVVVSGDSLGKEDFEYNIKPSLLGKPAAEEEFLLDASVGNLHNKVDFAYGSLMVWNEKKIMVIDKKIPENWQLSHEVRVNLLILENNAVNNLASLPGNLVYDKLILGNSTSYHVAMRLKNGFTEGTDIVFPKEDGAFTMVW